MSYTKRIKPDYLEIEVDDEDYAECSEYCPFLEENHQYCALWPEKAHYMTRRKECCELEVKYIKEST